MINNITDFGCLACKPKTKFLNHINDLLMKHQKMDKAPQPGAAFTIPLSPERRLLTECFYDNTDIVVDILMESYRDNHELKQLSQNHKDFLQENFDVSFHYLVTNAIETDPDYNGVIDCELITLNHKLPFVKWVENLVKEKVLDNEYHGIDVKTILSKSSPGCILVNTIKPESNKIEFVRDNFVTIFETVLNNFCTDPARWPNRNSYETFIEWIEWDCLPLYQISLK